MPCFIMIAAVLVALPVIMGFYFTLRTTEWKRWLRENQYQEIRKSRRYFFQGPFTTPGGYAFKVYEFTIKDSTGRVCSGWVRFWCTWTYIGSRRSAEVDWDEESASS